MVQDNIFAQTYQMLTNNPELSKNLSSLSLLGSPEKRGRNKDGGDEEEKKGLLNEIKEDSFSEVNESIDANSDKDYSFARNNEVPRKQTVNMSTTPNPKKVGEDPIKDSSYKSSSKEEDDSDPEEEKKIEKKSTGDFYKRKGSMKSDSGSFKRKDSMKSDSDSENYRRIKTKTDLNKEESSKNVKRDISDSESEDSDKYDRKSHRVVFANEAKVN